MAKKTVSAKKKKRLEADAEFGRIELSPEYAELQRKGKLKRVIKLRSEYRKLLSEAENLKAEIRRCADLSWTDKFAMRMLSKGKNARRELMRHFGELEERRQNAILRSRQVAQKVIDLGGYFVVPSVEMPPVKNRKQIFTSRDFESGRSATNSARYRDSVIKRFAHLKNAELSKRLDLELVSNSGTSLGIPLDWIKLGVTTYTQAFAHPKTKNRFQKMIWNAKAAR